MKIAIMQPYFFPYLGYLSLIKHTDLFILFDTVQFIRHGWIERNRILKPSEDWQYIQIPLLKHERDTLIKDVLINNADDWKSKIFAQLMHYKKKAPYYSDVSELLKSIFSYEYQDIVSLNKMALIKTCSFLGIDKKIEVFSQLQLPIEPVYAPDEWALNICRAIGNVDEYWNPPGGKSFFDKSKYELANIKLKYHTVRLSQYTQKGAPFIPGLSIIDVLMFNSKATINKMLDDYVLD